MNCVVAARALSYRLAVAETETALTGVSNSCETLTTKLLSTYVLEHWLCALTSSVSVGEVAGGA
jgi:hypothetical protein